MRLLVGSRFAGEPLLLVKRALLAKHALLAKRVLPGQTQTSGRTRIASRARLTGPNANYRPHANFRPNVICWPERNLLTKNKVTDFFLLGPLITMVFSPFLLP